MQGRRCTCHQRRRRRGPAAMPASSEFGVDGRCCAAAARPSASRSRVEELPARVRCGAAAARVAQVALCTPLSKNLPWCVLARREFVSALYDWHNTAPGRLNVSVWVNDTNIGGGQSNGAQGPPEVQRWSAPINLAGGWAGVAEGMGAALPASSNHHHRLLPHASRPAVAMSLRCTCCCLPQPTRT